MPRPRYGLPLLTWCRNGFQPPRPPVFQTASRSLTSAWAYDGSAQGGKKIAFGNTWVIAAIVISLPWCSSPVALPILFRLWRGKGTPSQVELAAQMLTMLTAAFPGRVIHGAGDAAFHGQALIRQGSTWTTRLPAKAVLYDPKPAPTGKRGQPRTKGARLGTPAQIAAGASWQPVTVRTYGKTRTVQAAVTSALWHGSFKDAPGQLVLVKDPGSGKPYDLALFTLDQDATAAASGSPASATTPPTSPGAVSCAVVPH